nr:DUF1307 domain-containing protein [Tissierella sp.]
MKNIKVFISIVAILLVITGCSGGSADTRTFELEKDGVKTTMVYTYEGDKVIKQSTENIIQYDLIGITTKEEAKAIFDPLVQEFQNLDGLTHSLDYSDERAVENLLVDYEKADFAKLRNLPGMSFDGDAETKGISMKKSAELLKSQGFKEVE